MTTPAHLLLNAEFKVGAALLNGWRPTSPISPDLFTELEVRQIVGAANRLAERGDPVDRTSIEVELNRLSLPPSASVLDEIQVSDTQEDSTREYNLRLLREAAADRRRADVWGRIGTVVQDGENATTAALLQSLVEEYANESAPGPGLQLRTLAEILADPDALKAPEPVIPRLAWAGRVSLLAAREKDGKSTIGRAGASEVSRGGEFLGERVKPGTVLWLNLEEHTGDAAAGFHTFGADPDRVILLDRVTRPLEDLRAAVSEVSPVLVVIDTLAAFTVGLIDDASNDTAWTTIMNRLCLIARDSGAAVLVLAHARKSDGKYRDSSRIGAGVDAILEMQPGDDPFSRKIEGRGRWAIEGCTVRLEGNRYVLAAGEISLDARVLLFIEQNPGCSMRKIRDGVTGRAEAIATSVRQLEMRGAVKDMGTGQGTAFFAHAVPGQSSGNRGGTGAEPVGNRSPGVTGSRSLTPKGGPGNHPQDEDGLGEVFDELAA